MTRYKKELQKRGYKLECDYPYIPYGHPALESVLTCVADQHIHISYCYVVGIWITVLDNHFKVIEETFY